MSKKKKEDKRFVPPPPDRSVRRKKRLGQQKDRVLVRMAKQVRRIYFLHRQAWEEVRYGRGDLYRLPSRYDGQAAYTIEGTCEIEKAVPSEWELLAKFFAKHKIDPACFIGYYFDCRANRDRAPEPNHFRGDKALGLWEKAQRRKGEEIALSLTIQQSVARTRASYALVDDINDAYALVLVNLQLELSALFRYCWALKLGGKRFRRIANLFLVEACVQFERYKPFYLKYWKNFLPKGMVERSQQIYADLFEDKQDDADDEEVEAV